jgi:hypothetical protein
MSVFAEGEEVVTIRLQLSKFEGLLKAGLIKDMNYEILRYSIVGESYNNEEYNRISKEIHKLSVKRDEILERLRNEQNTTSGNTD